MNLTVIDTTHTQYNTIILESSDKDKMSTFLFVGNTIKGGPRIENVQEEFENLVIIHYILCDM